MLTTGAQYHDPAIRITSSDGKNLTLAADDLRDKVLTLDVEDPDPQGVFSYELGACRNNPT